MARIWATFCVLACAAMVVYALTIDFVPSLRWSLLQFRLTFGLAACVTLAIYWAMSTGRWPLESSPRRKIAAFLAIPFLLFLPAWAIVCRIVPDTASLMTGMQKSIITDYTREQGPRIRGCSRKLKATYLAGTFPGYLCVSEASFDQMPEKGIIVLVGRASWFGYRVEGFRAIDPGVSP